MSVPFPSDSHEPASNNADTQRPAPALLQGEILVETRSHSAWGGAVTAQMYLPLRRDRVWQQLTDYPRWVQYFPDLIRSEVLNPVVGAIHESPLQGCKRLYQDAHKACFFLSIQVEAYLNVFEVVQQQIKFRLEKGSFTDFAADLKLQDAGVGTLLTYEVQATPTIPVPSIFIEQAIKLDLPANMGRMRQILCGS